MGVLDSRNRRTLSPEYVANAFNEKYASTMDTAPIGALSGPRLVTPGVSPFGGHRAELLSRPSPGRAAPLGEVRGSYSRLQL